MDVHGAALAVKFIAPDAGKQPVTRKDLHRMLEHQVQQLVFLQRERQLLAAGAHGVRGGVALDVPAAQRLAALAAELRPAQQSAVAQVHAVVRPDGDRRADEVRKCVETVKYPHLSLPLRHTVTNCSRRSP